MSLFPDRNFDSLTERFKSKIYGGLKGEIRLAVLTRDFQDFSMFSRLSEMKVLDAGGGFAPFSQSLVLQGADCLVCDISEKMLQQAREDWERQKAQALGSILFVRQPFQEIEEKFDIVLCHAVIEWLERPWEGIERLVQQCNPGGVLSLLIFNQVPLIWRMVTFGKLEKVQKQQLSGFGNSFTPYHSFRYDEIHAKLEQLGMEILCCSGVRIFSDSVRDERKRYIDNQELLALELHYSRDPDFYNHGRYLHFLARKRETVEEKRY